jgi:hypothetical protein
MGVPAQETFNRTVLPLRLRGQSGEMDFTLLGKNHVDEFLKDAEVKLGDLGSLVGKNLDVLISNGVLEGGIPVVRGIRPNKPG